MAINFPDSPTSGDLYSVNDLVWQYDGVKWVINTAVSGGLLNIVEDTTPQLGGNLDLNGYSITSPYYTGNMYSSNGFSQYYVDIATTGTGNFIGSSVALNLKAGSVKVLNSPFYIGYYSNSILYSNFTATYDSSITLGYNSSTKLQTTSTGVSVTGGVSVAPTTGQDNSIDFTVGANLEITATAANITAVNVSSAIGRSGVIIVHSATNITGWGTEFKFPGGTAPTISNSDEVFAYYIEDASNIWIGLVQ